MNATDQLISIGLRGVAAVLAPGGRKGSLSILMYHRVLTEPDPMFPFEPDAARFARQMDVVGSVFNVLPMGEAVERLAADSLPSRAVCITFDDGYANNLHVAAPILRERKLPATVFVATGFIDGGSMWNDKLIEAARAARGQFDLSRWELGEHEVNNDADRLKLIDHLIGRLKYLDYRERVRVADEIVAHTRADLSRCAMMSEAQLRKLAGNGIDIGAHTVNHPILASQDEATAQSEIMASKERLEAIVGAPVPLFAYPNGRPERDYRAEHVRIARACGFKAAVSTAWGVVRKDDDFYQMPRIAPWDRNESKFAARVISSFRSAPAQKV